MIMKTCRPCSKKELGLAERSKHICLDASFYFQLLWGQLWLLFKRVRLGVRCTAVAPFEHRHAAQPTPRCRNMIGLLQEEPMFAKSVAEACVSGTVVASQLCTIIEQAFSEGCMQPAAIHEGATLLHAITSACCEHACSSSYTTHAFLSTLVSSLANVGVSAESVCSLQPISTASAMNHGVHFTLKAWLLLAWQTIGLVFWWPEGTQHKILEDEGTVQSLLRAAVVALQQFSFPEGMTLALRYATCKHTPSDSLHHRGAAT
jgi:hypothetical protein